MRKTRAMAAMRWVVLMAVVIGAGVLLVLAVRGWLRPAVEVTRVVESSVVQAFYATGTLQPEREYPIRSNNAGALVEVLVDKGDRVSKDQALAVVAEDAVQFRHDQAKAEFAERQKLADEESSPVLREFDARITATGELLEIAHREQRRVMDMLERNAASQVDLDRSMDRVKTLWSELESLKAQKSARRLELNRQLEVAEAALKIARWNLERQTIRSPIDHGAVLDRPLGVGTRVAVNDPIMVVADVRPERLVVRAAVDEEDRVNARLDQLVYLHLYAFPGRVFEGRVKRIYDRADPDRRTFEVDVETAEKNPSFAAGMTGELVFVMEQKAKAAVIPTQAVQNDAVWVVRDGLLARAEVTLGLRSVERTEIISGLDDGDLVLVSPIGEMAAGQRVRAAYIDPQRFIERSRPEIDSSFKGFR